MITEKEYLEAKKIVQEYESKHLNISAVSGTNYCKQCKKEIDKGFRFCSGICKEYYYR